MEAGFFSSVKASLFGGHLLQRQVDGINSLAQAWETHGSADSGQFAYVLATAFHETAETMQPIIERGAKPYFDKYEHRNDLGNTQPGDGYRYRGRGFVQITGRANYGKWAKILGVDLIGSPNLALEMGYAGRIAIEGMVTGSFTGKKLADYISAKKRDFVGARRIINGQDRAKLIAGYAANFYTALA